MLSVTPRARGRRPGPRTWAAAALLALAASPAAAQELPPVIHGRIEDAATREPVAGARVMTADSSASAVTDEDGRFHIVVRTDSLVLQVEQYGYVSSRFELAPEAPRAISVLLLEPAPIELPGMEVVQQGALTEVLEDLARRRNAYPHSMRALDRTQLERSSALDAWALLRRRVPGIHECDQGWSGLCVRGRPTPRNSMPEVPVTICIDGGQTFGAVGALESLDMDAVSLVEIYAWGREGVRIYTAGYLTASARRGRSIATPLGFGGSAVGFGC